MYRQLDDVGRIVLPKEMRNILKLNSKDKVSVLLQDKKIILEKINIVCNNCGSDKDLQKLKNISLCQKCIENLNKN